MKHRRILAVAHNYADSLACGVGFVVGHCSTDIFGEAAKNTDLCIEVDFLAGRVVTGNCSKTLAAALRLYKTGFEAFCVRSRVHRTDFSVFRARYFQLPTAPRYTIFVKDRFGKSSSREYEGFSGKRVKVLDNLGRLRPKNIDVS
ncbi:hypothetical protein IWQ48_004827 [Labrenzia sp. EL_13]|nr:hypothetical protein [Labrenzia sp. EL_13]MBG6206460.1 hypothetical protein [Labrenzia sp. EL_126]